MTRWQNPPYMNLFPQVILLSPESREENNNNDKVAPPPLQDPVSKSGKPREEKNLTTVVRG